MSDLAAFFVFNPTLGDEVTEGQKILAFFPKIDVELQKVWEFLQYIPSFFVHFFYITKYRHTSDCLKGSSPSRANTLLPNHLKPCRLKNIATHFTPVRQTFGWF